MSSDKIIEILKEKPSLSSRQIYDVLREDQSYTESYRTLQTRLQKMHKERLLKTNSIGREIYYSVFSSSESSTTDYFYAKVWNDLFDLRGRIRESFGSQETNFIELRGLTLMLPSKAQEELKPTFDKVLERIKQQDFAGKILYMDVSQDCENMPDASSAQIYNQNFMFELVGLVASALHKCLEPTH